MLMPEQVFDFVDDKWKYLSWDGGVWRLYEKEPEYKIEEDFIFSNGNYCLCPLKIKAIYTGHETAIIKRPDKLYSFEDADFLIGRTIYNGTNNYDIIKVDNLGVEVSRLICFEELAKYKFKVVNLAKSKVEFEYCVKE